MRTLLCLLFLALLLGAGYGFHSGLIEHQPYFFYSAGGIILALIIFVIVI